jgi:hypothetical protein
MDDQNLPLTEEQQMTLASFASKRDILLGQLSQLQKEYDIQNTKNLELTTSNSALVADIAANTESLAQLKGSYEPTKAGLDAEIAAKNAHVQSLASTIDSMTPIVSGSQTLMDLIKNASEEMLTHVAQSKEIVTELVAGVKDNSSIISAHLVDVKTLAVGFKEAAENGIDKIFQHDARLQDKERQLGQREAEISLTKHTLEFETNKLAYEKSQ